METVELSLEIYTSPWKAEEQDLVTMNMKDKDGPI